MATKAWNVEISGKTRYVELDHGTITGTRKVTVDDRVVVDEGMRFGLGQTIPFGIEGQPAELEISKSGYGWDYALKVNDRVVEQL